MKTKIAILATMLASVGLAAAQTAAAGFEEATAIVTGADTLVDSVLPIVATIVGVGVAMSLVKLVKRK